MTFVDTPGLGSLATAGAGETVAYLPRCDLGIVLIDAASTPTHEDLAVVQSLYHSGARAMVLVSKADLLGPAERQQMAGYAVRQLAAQLSLELPAHLVSVVGADAALTDQWMEKELMPLVERHREERAAALKRKVGGLRDAVITVLENRLQRGSQPSPTPSARRAEETLVALRSADALYEDALRDGDDIADGRPTLADAIIGAAAAELTRRWLSEEGRGADVARTVSVALQGVLTGQLAELIDVMARLRSQLERALELAHRVLPVGEEWSEPLPLPAGAPIADTIGVTRSLVLKRPVLLPYLGAAVLRHHTRSRLEKQLRETLPELLGAYRQQVRQWFRESLMELRTGFAARAGPLRVQLEAL
ncbi:MAG: hypothetical protein OIN84_10555, partial [Candidatus Methanoperedens sp.]|nr:hypothetical protein [Candidatus Methanoperedens sp.]